MAAESFKMTINNTVPEWLDEIRALIAADPRRSPEFVTANERLGAANAILVVRARDNGVWVMPSERAFALLASLKLRHVLDLPTMDAPDV